jgi:sigma-B regulation protein RsbU (phosphoserine phosphatase)
MVNTAAPRHFLMDETQLLGLLGTQLAQTLERERLNQEALARQRLEQELDLARAIQASFLPDSCPFIPGYAICAFYRAARQVGGDFYDFIKLAGAQAPQPPALTRRELEQEWWRTGRGAPRVEPRRLHQRQMEEPDRFGMVIADVTDKGVPASLFMVLSRTLIRATASDGRPPDQVLEQANRLILADARSGLFVTCFYGILDLADHSLTYANGGHNYPLVYRAETGAVESLHAQGIVLGIVPEARFELRTTALWPGDVLCLYTDGVTEAMDVRRQLFDEERLIEVLRHTHQLTPDEIVSRIIEAVSSFAGGAAQTDDITLVVVKRNA